MHQLTKCILICCFLLGGFIKSHAQAFIANKGQWDAPFEFKVNMQSAAVYLREDGMRIHLQDPSVFNEFHDEKGQHKLPKGPVQNHAFDVLFNGIPKNIEPSKELETYHNYYLGKDPSRWKSKVPLFEEIHYQEIYKGIDLILKSEPASVKYDLIVKPGASPSQIKWSYVGVLDLQLQDGRLIIKTSVGSIVEEAPVAWQIINDKYLPVEVAFELKNREITFLLGEYDSAHELIIDPNFVFSTYTGSTADNFGYTATYDLAGNTYGGGIVFDNGYPVSIGAFQDTIAASGNFIFDCSISKFNSTGTSLIYSTYLGGSQNDQPHSMVVDSAGNLIVLGVTGSANFPVSTTAMDTSYNGGPNVNVGWSPFSTGVDMFITKFSADGTSLVGSTYLGGTGTDGVNQALAHNYGDAARGEVITDMIGNVYFASSTSSSNFPTAGSAIYQDSIKGGQDAVFGKLSSDLSSLTWCSYLGGTNNDAGYSLKLNQAETKVFLAGGTRSNNFPIVSNGSNPIYQSNRAGDIDGWIGAFNSSNGSIINTTYNGTGKYDQNFFIALDLFDDVYVFGQTKGHYPTTPGLWGVPHSSQYIHKFSGNTPNFQSVKSMVFGDGDTTKINISPTALMVDACRSVYISGWGGSTNNEGNTFDLPVTADAYDTITDGSDFYFLVLDGSWKFPEYATFFGGPGNEHVDGGTSRFSPQGNIHQAVCAGCGGNSNFPAFPSSVWSTTNNSTNCNLACVKVDFDLQAANVNITLIPDSACLPHKLNFVDKSTNVDIMLWDFDDGTTFIGRKPNKVFDTAGTYMITIIGIDTLCNTSDTAVLPLYVFSSLAKSTFTVDFDTCNIPFQVNLTNTSNGSAFYWDFGDGTNSTLKEPTKVYGQVGTYVISLAVRDDFCDTWDTSYATVIFYQGGGPLFVNASYDPCEDWQKARFVVNPNNKYHIFDWDMGDGGKRQGQIIEYNYAKPGTYIVRLTATDTICGNISTFEVELMVVKYDELDEFLPNVFTPNGDGVNEDWKLIQSVSPENFAEFKVQVFNRWGSLIYETDNPWFEWNGTFADNELADGVYFWVVWYKDMCGKANEKHGEVHVIR